MKEKSPSLDPNQSGTKWLVILFVVLGGTLVGFLIVYSRHPLAAGKSNPSSQAPSTNAATTSIAALTHPAGSPQSGNVTHSKNLPPPIAVVLPNYPDFQKRPFPVAFESSRFQWTSADGRDTNVIRQLAHNPLEYDRMVDENSRIFKRELVYLKETPAGIFEQAKLGGNQVAQLTLPGLDGQEMQFQIVRTDSKGSSRQGMFSGHLVDNTDSLVTLAFEDGRQAFTILSPKDNIFLVGEPREDGQVIVKAINPNTWGVGPAEADDALMTEPNVK